jgi:hypothetical protein
MTGAFGMVNGVTIADVSDPSPGLVETPAAFKVATTAT